MTKRTLSLKREALTELTGSELTAVAGAQDALTPACPRTLVIRECLAVSNVHTCLDCLTRTAC